MKHSMQLLSSLDFVAFAMDVIHFINKYTANCIETSKFNRINEMNRKSKRKRAMNKKNN